MAKCSTHFLKIEQLKLSWIVVKKQLPEIQNFRCHSRVVQIFMVTYFLDFFTPSHLFSQVKSLKKNKLADLDRASFPIHIMVHKLKSVVSSSMIRA